MAGFVLIGNPGSRRVELFQAALERAGEPPARLLAWADLLAGRAELGAVVRPGDIVRIESPGRDFAVEQLLLALGAGPAEAEGGDALASAVVGRLPFDKGLILYPRQWYLGLCAALDLVRRQLAGCPRHRLMADPAAIATMFDKRACHALLLAYGVAVPRSLGAVSCYDELLEAMQRERCWRVFVKLAHGSSASGVVAYQVSRGRHQATTTVELAQDGAALRLYNSRRLRSYTDPREIGALIDALCRQHVHVERWLPKAGVAGRTFDLRVVVIAGRARHTVARLSRGPMTNLHLLNERGDLALVRGRMSAAAWQAARQACERAMGCFAASLYAGIDLLVAPDFRGHAVLEVNAFGDLLPGLLCEGQDTYAAQIAAMRSAA